MVVGHTIPIVIPIATIAKTIAIRILLVRVRD
jgi:hypothetical protein